MTKKELTKRNQAIAIYLGWRVEKIHDEMYDSWKVMTRNHRVGEWNGVFHERDKTKLDPLVKLSWNRLLESLSCQYHTNWGLLMVAVEMINKTPGIVVDMNLSNLKACFVGKADSPLLTQPEQEPRISHIVNLGFQPTLIQGKTWIQAVWLAVSDYCLHQ